MKNSELIINRKKKNVVITTDSATVEEAKLDITTMKKHVFTLPASNSSMGEKRQSSSNSRTATGKHMICTGHKHQLPTRKRQRQEDYHPNIVKPVIFVLSHRKLLGKGIFQFMGDQEWLFVAMVCLKWCSVYRESFKVTQTGLLNTLHSLSRLKYACEQLGFDPSFLLIRNMYGVPWNLEYWAGYQAELQVVSHVKDMCDSDGSDACRGAAQAGRKSLLHQLYMGGNYAFKQDILYYAAMSNTKSVLVWLHKKKIGIWNDLSMSACLMTAAMYGRKSNAKWLIKMGASWHNHSGSWAKIRGQKRFLKWALRNGSTIEPLSYLHCPTVIPAVSSSPSSGSSLANNKRLAIARSKVRKSLIRTPSNSSRAQDGDTAEEGEIV